MKIRIYGNSVRIRLGKSELNEFNTTGFLQEKTEFGATTFYYRLERVPGNGKLDASFADNTMILQVPAGLAAEWAATEQVSIRNEKPLGNGRHLGLLLEKDFKCIDNTGGEDQSDNFENPSHAC